MNLVFDGLWIIVSVLMCFREAQEARSAKVEVCEDGRDIWPGPTTTSQ